MNSIIRPIQQNDAAAFAEMFNTLLSKTKFLLFKPGERTVDAEFWETRIAEFMRDEFVDEYAMPKLLPD